MAKNGEFTVLAHSVTLSYHLKRQLPTFLTLTNTGTKRCKQLHGEKFVVHESRVGKKLAWHPFDTIVSPSRFLSLCFYVRLSHVHTTIDCYYMLLLFIAVDCCWLLLIAVDCCCMQSKDVKGLDTSPDRHLSATTLRPSVTLTSDLVLTEVRLLHPTACWKPASGVANLGSGWFTFCRMSAKVNPTTLHVPLFASWSDSHLPGPLRSPHQLLCEG